MSFEKVFSGEQPYYLHCGDCLAYLKTLPPNSISAVVTDPPYKYLDHHLETDWDEQIFFKQAYRVLKPDSFLVFFGRGESFYRWNLIAKEVGFKFKEEIIWDKSNSSSPTADLMRCHETIAVYAKGKPRLNKVWINKIDYDIASGNYQRLENDLKRIISKLNGIKTGEEFLEWRDKDMYDTDITTNIKHSITKNSQLKYSCRARATLHTHTQGKRLSSIIRVNREHYNFEHPTQKPLELMIQLLQLISKEGETVLDPFTGSGTTGVACINLNRRFIGCELHTPYYEIAKARIEQALNEPKQEELFNDSMA